MARVIILLVIACVFIGTFTFALAKYAYPEYIRYKEKVMEQQAEMHESQMERDEMLVEEAERED